METKINLYGASGHCKVIVDILLANSISIEMIIDDDPKLESISGVKVNANSNFKFDENSNWIISIGNNKVRKMLSENIKANFIKAIHPSAIISPFSNIGKGSVVMAGGIVNSDSVIGSHCIINSGAIIEHDAMIHDFVHICPGVSLAGNVTVGEGTHVGIGATVIQGIKIGKWVTIGAGAVVVKNIPDYAVVVGTPGKIIKYNTVHE